MREIKFRAWDKKQEKMFYDGDLYYLPHFDSALKNVTEKCLITNKGIYFWLLETQLKHADDRHFDHAHLISTAIEIMQFTGLFDKNGKEIYEGDIAKITYKDAKEIPDGFIYTEIGVMEWVAESAQFAFYMDKSLFEDHFDNMTAEIIGNIYENPEFLTPNAPKQ